MPRFDNTGPNGYGPMTGRGAGYCGQGGLGFGCGTGMMRGRCVGYGGRGGYYRPSKGDLQDEAAVLKEELKIVEEEIKNFKEK